MTTEQQSLQLDPFSDVLEAIKAGKMVVMVDDGDREDEGDLVIATEFVGQQEIAFMMEHARGLICVSIDRERAQRLSLPPQVFENSSPFLTPFTVSIDHQSVAKNGCEASARVHTMQRLIADDAQPQEFVTPGHVFPLVANLAGVLGRRGQTEGSLDIARLAGMKPSGVICEILAADGTIARGDDLQDFAKKFGLLVTSVEEVAAYRRALESSVRETAHSIVESAFGEVDTRVFQDDRENKEHLSLIFGVPENSKKPPLVRLHSECLTGDVFGSRRCDCGPQLAKAIEVIRSEGYGVVLYLRQEGRGIGLDNKILAYALQDKGHDTVEANELLGFAADKRDFAVGAAMLHSLGLNEIRLMTNNPEKVSALEAKGIKVTERIPLIAYCDEESKFYLDTKRSKLGHLL
jgi:3,4-dihydroxy 2-butanone 4-phosphate synthase / GTP cyclohydrolase II